MSLHTPDTVEEVLEVAELRQEVEGWKTSNPITFFSKCRICFLKMGKKCALMQLSVISQHDPSVVIALCTFVLIFDLTCVSKTK